MTAVKMIWERLQTTNSQQKSYTDKRRRPLEFQVGDLEFLKVAPLKGVMWFGKKGKLSLRYVGCSLENTRKLKPQVHGS